MSSSPTEIWATARLWEMGIVSEDEFRAMLDFPTDDHIRFLRDASKRFDEQRRKIHERYWWQGTYDKQFGYFWTHAEFTPKQKRRIKKQTHKWRKRIFEE